MISELEEALKSRPDDEARWLVYADQLQAEGDVRGELVALQLQLEKASHLDDFQLLEQRERDLFSRHADVLAGFYAGSLEVTWWRGFWKTANLGLFATSGQYQDRQLEQALRHPAARWLETVRVDPPRARVLAFASLLEPALDLPHLRHFIAGEPHALGDFSLLLSRRPTLEALSFLELGGAAWPTVSHPRLKELKLVAWLRHLPERHAEALDFFARSSFPGLQKLDLTLHGAEVPEVLGHALRALEARAPQLHALTLECGEGSLEPLTREVLGSGLLPRLKSLTINLWPRAPGVELLVRERARFRHLTLRTTFPANRPEVARLFATRIERPDWGLLHLEERRSGAWVPDEELHALALCLDALGRPEEARRVRDELAWSAEVRAERHQPQAALATARDERRARLARW